MIILGVDQSYARSGFAIVKDNKLIYSTSIIFKKNKTKKDKREILKLTIENIEKTFKPNKIVVERTRLYSRGFISIKTIIALGSLITTIIDATNLDVFSVDSRSFKAKVVGHANCSKQDVMDWAQLKFGISANEDEADAIAIAFYSFMNNPLLRKEND